MYDHTRLFFFSSRRRHTILQGDWSSDVCSSDLMRKSSPVFCIRTARGRVTPNTRSEEHTSELQSPCNLVCRLLLEKKMTESHSNWSASSTPAVGASTIWRIVS